MLSSFIDIKDINKSYTMGEVIINAVNNISFSIEKGEFVVIVGPSGAGKTTVLNILGGMDSADSGELIIDGKNISQFDKKQLTKYRREDVGFIFQFYNLVPNLTALENVELSTQIKKDAKNPKEVLESVGLSDRLNNFPGTLSGGEQQRVAIARAIAKNPKLLLCDEPTGALDYETGKNILNLLKKTCEETGTTVVLITHNQAITPMADKVIEINNSKVRSVKENPNPKPISEIEW